MKVEGIDFLKIQVIYFKKCYCLSEKQTLKFPQLAHRRGNIPIHMQLAQKEGKVYCKEALF